MSTNYENNKNLLNKNGFKYIFNRDLFYNPVTHTIITEEFIEDKPTSEIKKILEDTNTEPSFHFSYPKKLTNERKIELLKELYPNYLSHDLKKKDMK